MTWDGGEPSLGAVFSRKMTEEFGTRARRRSEIRQSDMDLAASVQLVLEENYFALLNYVQKQTGAEAVCLAGGVALNCVANGMIFERTTFRDVYVQPAAHDAGTSIGAALYVRHQELKLPRCFVMRHVYYGPEYSDAEILRDLEAAGCTYQKLAEEDLIAAARRRRLLKERLSAGSRAGWSSDRAPWGTAAFWRIPRRKDMKDILNSSHQVSRAVPAVLPLDLWRRGSASISRRTIRRRSWCRRTRSSPEQRERIPAVTHGDGTEGSRPWSRM